MHTLDPAVVMPPICKAHVGMAGTPCVIQTCTGTLRPSVRRLFGKSGMHMSFGGEGILYDSWQHGWPCADMPTHVPSWLQVLVELEPAPHQATELSGDAGAVGRIIVSREAGEGNGQTDLFKCVGVLGCNWDGGGFDCGACCSSQKRIDMIAQEQGAATLDNFCSGHICSVC